MIAIQPMAALAPLDYRYALDATLSLLGGYPAPLVQCNIAELMGEIRQRIPLRATPSAASAALWIEPLVGTWQEELSDLARVLPAGAPLALIASRPLALALPERRAWIGRPLGVRPVGVARLRRALSRSGFRIEASYGIHSMIAIALNVMSQQLARWGHPDIGDRMHFAARLRYCVSGPLAPFSTVALLFARKERA